MLTTLIPHRKNLPRTWKFASLFPLAPLALRKGTASFKSIMMPPPPLLFPVFSHPTQSSHASVHTSHNTKLLFINKCLEVQSKAQANKNLLGLSAGVSHQQQRWPWKTEGELRTRQKELGGQRKEMLQVFEELGIKDRRKATEVEAQLFFFFFSFFYFKLESKALKNDLNIHGQKIQQTVIFFSINN